MGSEFLISLLKVAHERLYVHSYVGWFIHLLVSVLSLSCLYLSLIIESTGDWNKLFNESMFIINYLYFIKETFDFSSFLIIVIIKQHNINKLQLNKILKFNWICVVLFIYLFIIILNR